MTHKDTSFGMSACPCRLAVIRAYHGMIGLGRGHQHALRVADRVFRWHQPLTPCDQREACILSWVQPHWLN